MHPRLRSKRFAGFAATGVALAVPLSLGVAPAQAAPAPDIKVTQNSSEAVITGDGIACTDQITGAISDTQYWRRFDLSQYGAANGFSVSKMVVAVDTVESTAGNVPGSVAVYAITHGAPLTIANLGSPLATVKVNYDSVPDGSQLTAPIAATVPAGKDMVLEVAVDEATTDETFFPGANESPEVGPTYLTSTACATPEPTALGDLGPFAGISNIFFALGKTTDCKNAEAAATSAAAAAATAAQNVTKATAKVKKAKKKLKAAKKSHNASKIKKAKKKVKKAKKALKAAKAAVTAANAAVTAANAAQGTKCAQPALPPTQARPANGSSHATTGSNGHAFSSSRS